MGNDLGHDNEKRVIDKETVVIGEVRSGRRSEQSRPERTFRVDHWESVVLRVDSAEFGYVECIGRAIGTESTSDLVWCRLDVLSYDQDLLKPRHQTVSC